MSKAKLNLPIPNGYARLPGSERRFSPKATLLGAVDVHERFSVTVVLRRRADGPPMPAFDYYANTPPRKRNRLSAADFTASYGAHPDDVRAVSTFATEHGLMVTKTHLGRRTVVLSGTAAQFSRAFAVSFSHFEIPERTATTNHPFTRKRTYRDHQGFVHVPQQLADAIVGVFGLDSRPIGRRSNNPGDPSIISPVSVQQVTQLYNFPSPGPAIGGQTIGIITPAGPGGGGYLQSDLDLTFSNVGLIAPQVIPLSADGVSSNATYTAPITAAAAAGATTLSFASTSAINPGLVGSFTANGMTTMIALQAATPTTADVYTYDPIGETWITGLTTALPAGTIISINLDGETNQDIAISTLAAAGANIAVYFTTDTQQGWVELIGRVLHPDAGDFPAGVTPPSVLSASWSISPGDDPDGFTYADDNWGTGASASVLLAITASFQDAAVLQTGPTICVASGDYGSFCGISDGYAHVEYPGSDPWILSCGGTTLGQYLPSGSSTPEWVEYAWNDPGGPYWGTGGGGVSAFFPVPSYQNGAGIPNSINGGITGTPVQTFPTTGRGVPDVASNASLNSGYAGLYMGGGLIGNPGNGTSAAAPLWAGLIAVLNSNAGFNIGFANPSFYTFPGTAFNHINPLWPDPAYPQLAGCPVDNSNSGTPGYPTHAGWDGVTGLGSPNGMGLLTALQGLEQVYIMGGYQSPDIILTDLSTNQPIPIGGAPSGRWDTLLAPSTNYGFSANVHNDSSAPATNVVVSFWAIPGGVGTNGSSVGTPQTVTIPPHSTVTVQASAPFTSAPSGQHLCAVVSLYSPAGCAVNATTALQIPNPGYSDTHQCSAWRNTDSMLAMPGQIFKFPLGFGRIPIPFEHPILLTLSTVHVPVDWIRDPVINQIQTTLRSVGAVSNVPLYLRPGFERHFQAARLKTTLIAEKGSRLEERSPGSWHLYPHREAAPVTIDITGSIPASAKVGDIILVNVIAHYPAAERHPARQVGFLEFIYVTDKLPRR
jgi:hypothetical protein